jgi:hypothetical protein
MYGYGHVTQTPQVLGSNPRGRTTTTQAHVTGAPHRAHVFGARLRWSAGLFSLAADGYAEPNAQP